MHEYNEVIRTENEEQNDDEDEDLKRERHVVQVPRLLMCTALFLGEASESQLAVRQRVASLPVRLRRALRTSGAVIHSQKRNL